MEVTAGEYTKRKEDRMRRPAIGEDTSSMRSCDHGNHPSPSRRLFLGVSPITHSLTSRRVFKVSSCVGAIASQLELGSFL